MDRERRAALLLFSTTVIWGSTFPTMKIAQQALLHHAPGTEDFAGLFLMTLRFVPAAILFALLFPKSVMNLTRSAMRGSLVIGVLGVAGIALQFRGLVHGSSAMVAFLTTLTVVTVPVIGILFLKQRLTRSLWFGAVISLAGVYLMTRPDRGSFGQTEILVLLSAFVFGFQIHAVNHYSRKVDPDVLTLWVFVHFSWMCAAILLLFPLGRSLLNPTFIGTVFQPLAEGSWLERYAMAWVMPYQAVFACIIAFWVFMRYQKDVPATRAAIIYCAEPVFAGLIAWAFFTERMKGEEILGGAVILAGNLVCDLLGRRRDPSPVPAEAAAPTGMPGSPPPGR